MLTIIVLLFAVAIGLLLILAARRPDICLVRRMTRIKAPRERIFPLIDSLRANARWLPYYMKDPAMINSFSGPDSGPGAQVDFSGNREVGSGRVTITGSSAPDRVTMRLQMIKPMACDNDIEFTLVPRGDATDVTWSMQGKVSYLVKIMQVLFNMDRMVGRDFEAGLANLKAIAEGADQSADGEAPGWRPAGVTGSPS